MSDVSRIWTVLHRLEGFIVTIQKTLISIGTGASSVWGSITGTLSDQIDLQAALNSKVDETRTLTINGVGYDLSADRTWTVVASGIAWGDITGTLSDQLDLQAALDVKANNTVINGYVIAPTITWISGYNYEVSAATYYIAGVLYSSPLTSLTLTAADLTDDRIDIFVTTTSSTATYITGTASTPPVTPDYDPTTQLYAGLATVTAGTTEPTLIQVWIYRENAGASAEWNLVSNSANIILNSISNPYGISTTDIEGTTVVNGNSFTATSGSSPIISLYDSLNFKIRSKASWAANRKLSIQFFNGIVAVGNVIAFGEAGYGFVSSSTGAYQNITIPLADFGAITAANSIRFLRSGGGGSIGFYIDEIQLINLGLATGSSGTVTSFSFVNSGGFTGTVSNSTSTPALTLTLQNAAADSSTKGQATFIANDFNATSGLISLDYTNGQASSALNKGYLTSTDWNTFNNKPSKSKVIAYVIALG